jgi:hypothetical protein
VSSSKASTAKTGREGREKVAVAYCEAEHVALLSYIGEVPDSFNASESSEEWKAVYSAMVNKYYIPIGMSSRQSSTLQSHFVDLYGGLKQGIRGLSLVTNTKKCPSKYDEKDEDVQKYCEELLSLIMSNPKKCCPNKWWTLGIMELLLNMHLQYTTNYAIGKQDPSFF